MQECEQQKLFPSNAEGAPQIALNFFFFWGLIIRSFGLNNTHATSALACSNSWVLVLVLVLLCVHTE